jgi:hypothetical protein
MTYNLRFLPETEARFKNESGYCIADLLFGTDKR